MRVTSTAVVSLGLTFLFFAALGGLASLRLNRLAPDKAAPIRYWMGHLREPHAKRENPYIMNAHLIKRARRFLVIGLAVVAVGAIIALFGY